MSMIPGMSSAMGGQGGDEHTNGRVKSFMCMMDSMTNQELDSTNPKIFEVIWCRLTPHPHTCCEMEQPAGVCWRLYGLRSLRRVPTPETPRSHQPLCHAAAMLYNSSDHQNHAALVPAAG